MVPQKQVNVVVSIYMSCKELFAECLSCPGDPDVPFVCVCVCRLGAMSSVTIRIVISFPKK